MLLDFLGSCDVCGKIIRTYRALAGHLRHNDDIDHQVLKVGWLLWRTQRRIETYRAQLRCRKCGSLWEIRDRSLANRKRCPACAVRRHTLGKCAYEAAPTIVSRVSPVVRQKSVSSVVWVRGDVLYREVVESFQRGEHVKDLMPRLGLTYKEERASLMKRRFGGACALEVAFSAQLQARGLVDIELNQWQAVAIGSEVVPREADIKLAVGDGR